jgi:phenylacetate-coenzyme A ligase PaaK-like adenylate-forming protein
MPRKTELDYLAEIAAKTSGTTGPATVTSFTATSNTSIAASNIERKLLTIFNEGAGILYVLYGNGTATTSNYSVRINSGDYLEIDKYTGAVFGLFDSAGTAKITEIT